MFSFTSAIVVVLLVLAKGVRSTALLVAAAGALIVVVQGLVAGVPMTTVIPGMIGIWLPALLLSVMLLFTRSLTLTLQLSILIAVLTITAIFVVAGNPVEYWVDELTKVVAALNEAQQYALAEWLEQQKQYAGQMTMVAVFANWSVHTVAFVIGYKMYRLLPGDRPFYGRFRDLNLGKVIAIVMAIASVGGMLTDIDWLRNVAFIMFGAFWTQGLAIVHWLYGQQMMPRIGLVAAYTMLLSFILTAVTVMGLAIFGYLDAWFNLRREPKIERD